MKNRLIGGIFVFIIAAFFAFGLARFLAFDTKAALTLTVLFEIPVSVEVLAYIIYGSKDDK